MTATLVGWLAQGHSFVVNSGWLQRGGTLINVSLEKRSVLSSSTSNLIFGMKEDGIVVLYLAAAAAGWQHFTFLTWQKLSCLDTSCSHDGIPSVHTVTNIFQNVTLFLQHFSSFWYPLEKVKIPPRALMKAVFSMLLMLLVNWRCTFWTKNWCIVFSSSNWNGTASSRLLWSSFPE